MRMVWLRLRNRYYLRHLRRKDLPDPIRITSRDSSTESQKPIVETEFVVFDTETTGLNVKKGDRIVSISAIRLKKGRIDLSDAFHALVNPNRDIPSSSAVVHEILPRMVDGKPPLRQSYRNLFVMSAPLCWWLTTPGLTSPSERRDDPSLRFSNSEYGCGYSHVGSGPRGEENASAAGDGTSNR